MVIARLSTIGSLGLAAERRFCGDLGISHPVSQPELAELPIAFTFGSGALV